MPHLSLAKVLESAPGVKKEGSAFVLSEESDANCFVSLGNEALQIPKVARIELSGAELVTVITVKGERYLFPPEQIIGLKFGAPESRNTKLHAGFSR